MKMAVTKCVTAPPRVTANVIEYLPLKSYLQRSTTTAVRSRSPDPPPSPRSFQRQAIYLELVNSNSKFNDETIFANAPEFFRTKIGLPKRKHEVSASGDFATPEKAKQTLYRPCRERTTNTGSEFQASKGGTHYYNRGCSGDAAGLDQGANSKTSLTNTDSKANTGLSKSKPKPSWKYVGNCKDSFTSFKDYCGPVEHSCRRASESVVNKSKRPLEMSGDENGDTGSHSKHKTKVLYRSKKEKADNSVEQVFAVNGAVVSFKGFEYQNFTNWFADPIRATKRQPEAYRKVLNFTGFTNREIVMKVYNGNRLVIEASRPCRGTCMAKTLKEVIDLPKELSVESLFMSRTPQGIIIIERAPPPNVKRS